MPTFFAVHFAERLSRTRNNIKDLLTIPGLKESTMIEIYHSRGHKIIKENNLVNEQFLRAVFNDDILNGHSTGDVLNLINEMISLLGCDGYE